MTCRKNNILVMLMMLATTAVMAQSAAVKQGDKNFQRFDFVAAADHYRDAVTKDGSNLSYREKLARTYVLLEDHVSAEAQYAVIVKMPGSAAINKLYYGLELRADGRYDEAQKLFNEYLAAVPDDARAKELAGSIDKVKALLIDTKIYEVSNIKALNTDASEMGATYYKDGIVFSSNRSRATGASSHEDAWTSRSFYDLYAVTGTDSSSWAHPLFIKGKQPNRKFHEGSATFSADGKEMYFTRSNYIKSSVKKSKDQIVKLQIMHADWDEAKKQWVNVQPTSLNNNEYNVAHPTLSKDGKKLYFISDMPGSLGETDIYVSDRNGTALSPPVNLGKGVNTKGREMFPYSADENTLYFSSDGLTGLGGLDVYSATFTSAKWGNVQNLGVPVNSRWDDMAYIVNAKNNAGYFTSNREQGQGDDDIYRFTRNGVTICGTVVDAQTKAGLSGAEVKLTEGDNLVAKKFAGDKGDFCFTALPNKKYKISAVGKEYEANSTSVSTGKANQVIQIPLSKTGGFDLAVCAKQTGAGTLEGATVELTNKATGVKKTCVITATCKCTFTLEPETDYMICATKESSNANGSYTHPCKDITTKDKFSPASLYENLDVTYLEKGMTVKIENLYYDLGKWAIRPDAAIELNKVVALMKEFPNMEIELSSHTDCRGSARSNDDLSTKRAKSCVDYLVANGIDKNRMLAVGYGERKLVNKCACEGNVKSTCTDDQHQANRRTEFKILKLK